LLALLLVGMVLQAINQLVWQLSSSAALRICGTGGPACCCWRPALVLAATGLAVAADSLLQRWLAGPGAAASGMTARLRCHRPAAAARLPPSQNLGGD
jgi:hypothetical protein